MYSVIRGADISNKCITNLVGFQTYHTAGGAVSGVIGIAFHRVENAIFISHHNTHVIDLVAIAAGFEIYNVTGLGRVHTIGHLLPGVDQISI